MPHGRHRVLRGTLLVNVPRHRWEPGISTARTRTSRWQRQRCERPARLRVPVRGPGCCQGQRGRHGRNSCRIATPGPGVQVGARNGPGDALRVGGQACTGSTFAGRYGKLGNGNSRSSRGRRQGRICQSQGRIRRPDAARCTCHGHWWPISRSSWQERAPGWRRPWLSAMRGLPGRQDMLSLAWPADRTPR